MRVLRAVAFASVVFVSSAHAATYYVSTTGNDTAAGAIDTPLHTITRAAQLAKPGDVVNVRGGVYSEKVTISSIGTATAPIVFQAMSGESAVLDGTALAAGTPIVNLVNTAFVDFSGFEIRNSPHAGISMWYAKNTRVLNNNIHDTTRNGIYAGGDNIGDTSDVTISGNTIHNTVLENQYHTMNGGWAGALVVARTNRATITGNRIYDNDGEGLIFVRSNYATIQKNEIFDSFSVYLYLDNARFATVDSNLLYCTGNSRYYRNGLPGSGLAVANETSTIMNPSSDNTFTNNIVLRTRWGFYYGAYGSGGGLKNTKVLNNTFYGTAQEIVRIENDAHSNDVVENNVFYQTGSAAPQYAGAGVITYATNVWYGGTSGAAAGAGDILADPRFVNAGGLTAADYKLTSLSPALRLGTSAAAVTRDYFGAGRGAVYDIGAHQYSTGSAATADAQAPTVPANLTTVSSSSTSVDLSWLAATDNVGVIGYKIYRNNAYLTAVTGTSYRDQAVTSNTTYTYAVLAYDAAGNSSALTPNVSVTILPNGVLPGGTADTQAPTAPAALAAAAASASVSLSWHAATDNVAVKGYAIYRNGVALATSTTTSWTDATAAPATTYKYEVSAFDAANNFSARSAVTVTTPATVSKARAAHH